MVAVGFERVQRRPVAVADLFERGSEVVTNPVRHDGTAVLRSQDDVHVKPVDHILFATSDGCLLGQRMLARLKELDTLLVAHTADLNRRHIKWKTDRYYRVLHARITSYVVNEVGRILNLIAADTDLTGIVTESLDFRHGGLSRTMNRIISRAGRGTVKTKLARLNETHGLDNHTVDPAYTSQQCSNCTHTHKTNRATRNRFRCKCCGHVLHADINGARCILDRRSDQAIATCNGATKAGRTAILSILTGRHAQTCTNGHKDESEPDRLQSGGTTQDRRNPASATGVSPKTP